MAELSKHYNASETEQQRYNLWEEAGCFEPSGKGQPFVIMMPPPNVTGTLHVGHALDNTLPDMLVRRARMQGKNALYQPGTDHASIAVHVVLDKQFTAEGVNRFDLGREKFMEKAWAWKAHSHQIITTQMRRLGISCAWKRERFTMDEGCSAAVKKAFVELYNRGLIYRGQRLVNWDPVMQTAVSDLEVKHKEIQGHIWHLKYPLSDGSGHVVIATTRPETMLGDTAVIAHPDDKRYQGVFGKTIDLPLVNKKIPIIADDYVDMEFGSGCMKVTPAHDFNDFEIGKRHNMELINILTHDGHINDNAPEKYRGLERFEARKQIVADFDALGLLEKVEEHVSNVGHAERNDTILEPYLTNQWFIKGQPLAQKCLAALENGDINFVLERDEKIYRHWMNNMQDWCISRQLWWGHRIPAWYHEDGQVHVGETAPKGNGWTQDEDIFDTWFSSALWPFSTQGWPEKTENLQTFYPNFSIMPGRDILPFWVMKMMMLGLELTGKPPFKTIYTHMMVLDEKGQKMSKSKGNVIDPITLMDAYGTDALRYTLVNQCALGQDIRLSDKAVENGRNFCTKLWNAAKFAQMNQVVIDNNFDLSTVQHPVNEWMLGKLDEMIGNVDKALDDYRFNDLASTIYHSVWTTYCDWYVELAKPLIYGDNDALKFETRAVMGHVLETMLRLIHPMMPFITEEIWQALTDSKNEQFLMMQKWPEKNRNQTETNSVSDVDWLINVITHMRAARSENNVPHKAEIAAFCRGQSEEDLNKLHKFKDLISSMTKVVSVTPRLEIAGDTDVVAVVAGFEIILPLEGVIDFAAERERVKKEIERHEAELSRINGMLENPNFVARAPAHVVSENKTRQEVLLADLAKLKEVAGIHA